MIINDCVLQNSEKIIFELRQLYSQFSYKPYRMSKFEEYDLYAQNKDFLVSDNVITFTDTNGKLLALKPDVTLSIIKNSDDTPDVTNKVYYNENVYRVSKDNGSYKEIMQAGVECFGKVGSNSVIEVLTLAIKSLLLLSDDCVLAVSNLDILENIASKLSLSLSKKKKLFFAISEKNTQQIDTICGENEISKLLKELIGLHGKIDDVLPDIDKLLSPLCDEYKDFKEILLTLSESKFRNKIVLDFSVTDDINYYNGIVFKGFVKNVPGAVLSGGQYDNLMKKLYRKSRAIGFAVYTDELLYLDLATCENSKDADNFVNIALPKGRLGEKIYDLFDKAGFDCPSIKEPNRKLIFENPENGVRYFWVKPSDVAIYVERGAADIGVAGKDILTEYEPDVYELLDLKKGKCRMAVASKEDFKDDLSRTLRVATKFAKTAQKFYQSQGRDIDIIHLNGSIEIAPILGLSDVIVDIVETGTTLKENNLVVFDEVEKISARLISNKSSYKFKSEKIELIRENLARVVEENND